MKTYNQIIVKTLSKEYNKEILHGYQNTQYISLLNIINKEIEYAKIHNLDSYDKLVKLADTLTYNCCKFVNDYSQI